MNKINIDLGDCTLTMVRIPGKEDLPDFYVSDTPVTIEQYKAMCQKNDPDYESWIEYYQQYETREYVGFTVASAITAHHVINFMNNIHQPIFYCLPSRQQWLHLIENHYDKIKWCNDNEFLGTEYKAIAWEMMRDNYYDIYCLLGVVNENGKRIIKGNNFHINEERDNIAFRMVCSEFSINSYLKNNKYENR